MVSELSSMAQNLYVEYSILLMSLSLVNFQFIQYTIQISRAIVQINILLRKKYNSIIELSMYLNIPTQMMGLEKSSSLLSLSSLRDIFLSPKKVS